MLVVGFVLAIYACITHTYQISILCVFTTRKVRFTADGYMDRLAAFMHEHTLQSFLPYTHTTMTF